MNFFVEHLSLLGKDTAEKEHRHYWELTEGRGGGFLWGDVALGRYPCSSK